MKEKSFRPCAMMLRLGSYEKFSQQPIEQAKIEKTEIFLDEDLDYFDSDYAPEISLQSEISIPVKAPHHLLIKSEGKELKSYFEIGFVSQQIMLYLTHLRLSYCLVESENGTLIPFSSGGKTIPDRNSTPNIARLRTVQIEESIYFENWQDHPVGFFENNHKMESIIRYVRFAPRIDRTEPLKFIMDREQLHLMATGCNGKRPDKTDMINAGMMLFNFTTSAEMLGLEGEWKLLREIDRPDSSEFSLPEDVCHIATWHGQLY